MVLALWLSLFLLLSLLLPFLPCLQLSLRTRFPFHDSQVSLKSLQELSLIHI